MIKPATLDFLRKLQANNHKQWFEEHKSDYLDAKKNVEDFVAKVKTGLMQDDIIEKSKLYRIYRDVRFSKDKTPYKGHLGGYLRRAGADRRGGYYFSIQPEESFVGGGFYNPNKEDLYRIRKEFEADSSIIRKILADSDFQKTYDELLGDGVKTAPKGFSKEHQNIDLIRKKQFYALHRFNDEEVLRSDFPDQVVHCYRALRPFFDYMSEVLTTNLNGESII